MPEPDFTNFVILILITLTVFTVESNCLANDKRVDALRKNYVFHNQGDFLVRLLKLDKSSEKQYHYRVARNTKIEEKKVDNVILHNNNETESKLNLDNLHKNDTLSDTKLSHIMKIIPRNNYVIKPVHQDNKTVLNAVITDNDSTEMNSSIVNKELTNFVDTSLKHLKMSKSNEHDTYNANHEHKKPTESCKNKSIAKKLVSDLNTKDENTKNISKKTNFSDVSAPTELFNKINDGNDNMAQISENENDKYKSGNNKDNTSRHNCTSIEILNKMISNENNTVNSDKQNSNKTDMSVSSKNETLYESEYRVESRLDYIHDQIKRIFADINEYVPKYFQNDSKNESGAENSLSKRISEASEEFEKIINETYDAHKIPEAITKNVQNDLNNNNPKYRIAVDAEEVEDDSKNNIAKIDGNTSEVPSIEKSSILWPHVNDITLKIEQVEHKSGPTLLNDPIHRIAVDEEEYIKPNNSEKVHCNSTDDQDENLSRISIHITPTDQENTTSSTHNVTKREETFRKKIKNDGKTHLKTTDKISDINDLPHRIAVDEEEYVELVEASPNRKPHNGRHPVLKLPLIPVKNHKNETIMLTQNFKEAFKPFNNNAKITDTYHGSRTSKQDNGSEINTKSVDIEGLIKSTLVPEYFYDFRIKTLPKSNKIVVDLISYPETDYENENEKNIYSIMRRSNNENEQNYHSRRKRQLVDIRFYFEIGKILVHVNTGSQYRCEYDSVGEFFNEIRNFANNRERRKNQRHYSDNDDDYEYYNIEEENDGYRNKRDENNRNGINRNRENGFPFPFGVNENRYSGNRNRSDNRNRDGNDSNANKNRNDSSRSGKERNKNGNNRDRNNDRGIVRNRNGNNRDRNNESGILKNRNGNKKDRNNEKEIQRNKNRNNDRGIVRNRIGNNRDRNTESGIVKNRNENKNDRNNENRILRNKNRNNRNRNNDSGITRNRNENNKDRNNGRGISSNVNRNVNNRNENNRTGIIRNNGNRIKNIDYQCLCNCNGFRWRSPEAWDENGRFDNENDYDYNESETEDSDTSNEENNTSINLNNNNSMTNFDNNQTKNNNIKNYNENSTRTENNNDINSLKSSNNNQIRKNNENVNSTKIKNKNDINNNGDNVVHNQQIINNNNTENNDEIYNANKNQNFNKNVSMENKNENHYNNIINNSNNNQTINVSENDNENENKQKDEKNENDKDSNKNENNSNNTNKNDETTTMKS